MMMERKPKSEVLYQQTLMEWFNFTELELETNKRGLVAQSQVGRLNEEVKEEADAMWLMLTLMLVGAAVAAVAMSSSGLPMIYLVIGAGILLLPMLFISSKRQRAAFTDADTRRVQVVHGVPRFVAGRNESVMWVQNRAFKIPPMTAHQMMSYELTPMSVYFTEKSHRILSLELHQHEYPEKLKNDLEVDDDNEALLMVDDMGDEGISEAKRKR